MPSVVPTGLVLVRLRLIETVERYCPSCFDSYLRFSLLFHFSTFSMVHYLRFLRTPQIADVSKKTIETTAVAAVTTDLGDSFLSHDVTVIARIVDATKHGEILCSSEVSWKNGMRAAKISLQCSAKFAGRLVHLHLTTRDTISAYAACEVPAIVDVWSSPFAVKAKAKAEPLVERRLQLRGKSQARIWEETGDSIARHIWFVVSLTAIDLR